MKILQCVCLASATGRYGGPYETSVAQSIIATSQGHEVTLLAGSLADDRPTGGPAELRLAVAQVRKWVPTPGFTGLFSLAFGRVAWREISQADLLHVSVSRELIPMVVMIMAVLQRKPWIAQTHGMLTARTSRAHQLVDCLLIPLLRRARTVVALTHEEASDLREWSADLNQVQIEVLGNPVNHPNGDGGCGEVHLGEDAVAFIARLHPRKRVSDFLAAAEIAQRRGLLGNYFVIGPDEGDGQLVEEAVANGAVTYLGAVSGLMVPQYVAACRVFVLCSEKEPWGNVLAQAITLGVPVVVTQSAALAPIVARFGAGVVVADGAPAALANAVDRLLRDPTEYADMAANCRRLSEGEWSPVAQSARLMQIYGITPRGPL